MRRHLVDEVPVSNLCNEYALQPSLFYSWLKLALEHLQRALAPSSSGTERRERELVAEVTRLKARLAKKDGVIAEISAAYVQLKKSLGSPERRWVPHDTRDAVIDFVRAWSDKTELPVERFIGWIGVARDKFFDGRKRYGRPTSTTRSCRATTG